METFIRITASFPTVIFTFLVFLSILFWLSSFMGLIDVDALDVDVPEIDGQMALNSDEGDSLGEAFAGLLTKLGLNGVPVTIVITLMGFFGYLGSYYMAYISEFVLGIGITKWILSIPIFLVALYFSVRLTALMIRPIRKFYIKVSQNINKKILGQTALVRSLKLDFSYGEVIFDDGGAGLILKAKAKGNEVFGKGDRVVLLEHVSEGNFYYVISEKEFMGA